MIALIGSEGSMGKRYQAILNHLGLSFIRLDLNHGINELKCEYPNVIICTPTDTHFEIVKYQTRFGPKNILCEKPICKSSKEVEEILKLVKYSGSTFNMVFQYGEIAHNNGNPHQFSSYDYFRTGNDGLYWDCLQIIALASGPIKLNNKSPTWKCEINDTQLDSSAMDHAYVKFIKKWSMGHIKQDHQWLIDIHKKVEDYEAKCTNSNSSPV